MSSSQPPLRRLPAPRWLLLVTIVVSAVLHGSFGWLVDQVFSAPEIDIEFQLPMDVELGLTDEVAMAPVAPPAPEAPPPAPEPVGPAEPGEGPEKPEKDKKKPETDAGKPSPDTPDAGPALAAADAGTASDASVAVGDQPVGSRLPPGAQIALRVDMSRIRASAIADDMRAFVAAVPDWKALLDGSGINPVDQLDRLLIATPDLKREKVVLAGRFVGEPKIVEDAVQKMATARGKKAVWHPEGNVRVVPWFNADETPRVLALVGPQHFTISRIEDLPRVLSIAAARAVDQKPDAGPVDQPADALLSMEEGEGLSLEVDGVEQFIKRAPRGVPQKLRIAALEVAGPAVDVTARLVFADGEKAADALRFWEAVRKAYARNTLMVFMGLAQPLQEATLELKEQEVNVRVHLSVEQTRLILGYVRELLTPPVPLPPAPGPVVAPAPKPASGPTVTPKSKP